MSALRTTGDGVKEAVQALPAATAVPTAAESWRRHAEIAELVEEIRRARAARPQPGRPVR